jgi:ribosome-binding factor A
MTSHRQQRVSQLLHHELSILITELTDPRLSDALVALTRVTVSADLHNARVYVEHALPPKESPRVLAALAHSETFLRKALVESLDLRVVPHLAFSIDDSGARAQRVDEILNSLAKDVADSVTTGHNSPDVGTEQHDPDDKPA